MATVFWVYDARGVVAVGACPAARTWDFLDGLYKLEVDIHGLKEGGVAGMPCGVVLVESRDRTLRYLLEFPGVYWLQGSEGWVEEALEGYVEEREEERMYQPER